MHAMSTIRLLTLNVCFEREETFGRRFSALVRYLSNKKYDVICLQECVDELYVRLRNSLGAAYHLSFPPETPYYTLMLVKKSLGDGSFIRKPLKSEMGRDVLFTDIKREGNAAITCATVHLESEDTHKTREIQMRQVNDLLASKKNALVMGDFNFPAHRNYKIVPNEPLHNNSLLTCLPLYTDAWPSLHGKDPGFTFDHARNQWKFDNISKAKGGHRFDRVMVRLDQSERFKLSSIALVCADPIGIEWEMEEHECNMYLSDHLGLETVISDSMPFNEPKPEVKPSESKIAEQPRKRPHVISEEADDDEIQFVDLASSKAARKTGSTSNIEAELEVLKTLLGKEPESQLQCIHVGLHLRNGKRVNRRFSRVESCEALYWWVCIVDPELLPSRGLKFSLRLPGETSDGILGNSEDIPNGELGQIESIDRTALRIVMK